MENLHFHYSDYWQPQNDQLNLLIDVAVESVAFADGDQAECMRLAGGWMIVAPSLAVVDCWTDLEEEDEVVDDSVAAASSITHSPS